MGLLNLVEKQFANIGSWNPFTVMQEILGNGFKANGFPLGFFQIQPFRRHLLQKRTDSIQIHGGEANSEHVLRHLRFPNSIYPSARIGLEAVAYTVLT